LAQEGWQITPLDKKIRSTPDDKLDELLLEAAKRRMLFDILQALEVFRPYEADDKSAEVDKGNVVKVKRSLAFRASDLAAWKYDDLLTFFNQRCDQFLSGNDWIIAGTNRDSAA